MRRGIVGAAAALLVTVGLAACGSAPSQQPPQPSSLPAAQGELVLDHSLELEYATQFSVDFYEGGYAAISIADGSSYLVIPQGQPIPSGVDEDTVLLQQPLDRTYLVATSAMDLICKAGALGNIRLSGTDADGWYIPAARQAMEEGEILYAGKYNAPDYELIYAEDCSLAIESTMIYHTPEVKEQLERLGVPVLVERSSYEESPLGRMEWIKLYGVLFDCEAQAEARYQQALEGIEEILGAENTGKTVAFFYITSNGAANVRKSGDYVTRMIEMAGGNYAFPDLGGEDNALSTVNLQMETFYAGAKDADLLIYNSTIDGELHTVEELLAKSDLLADFKAVKEGNVWCTSQNLFQSTMGLGDMIRDTHTVLTEEDPSPESLTFLYRLT